MSEKVFNSIKRGLKQAILHAQGDSRFARVVLSGNRGRKNGKFSEKK